MASKTTNPELEVAIGRLMQSFRKTTHARVSVFYVENVGDIITAIASLQVLCSSLEGKNPNYELFGLVKEGYSLLTNLAIATETNDREKISDAKKEICYYVGDILMEKDSPARDLRNHIERSLLSEDSSSYMENFANSMYAFTMGFAMKLDYGYVGSETLQNELEKFKRCLPSNIEDIESRTLYVARQMCVNKGMDYIRNIPTR